MSVGLYTTCDGRSLHEALGTGIARERQRGPAPAMRFLPGTLFTNGEALFEVVYGAQGLGPSPAGWVAAVRTDYVDCPDDAPERYCYSLFAWPGKARDGCIIIGGKRASILRLIQPAPRLARAMTEEDR